MDVELDTKLNSGNSHPTIDPYAYYEKTVDEISELSKKLALASKSIILTPSKIGNADKNQTTPEVLPQVTYTSKEGQNYGVYSGGENIDGVGSVYEEGMGPSTAFEGKSANPNPDPHLHSHSYSHTHTHTHSQQKTFGKGKAFHSMPVITPTIYGTSSPDIVYPQSPAFSSKAEAHAKAETYNRGNIAHIYSDANSKSISHAQVGGVLDLKQNFQTDSTSGVNHGFNTGYGQSTIHANAQANSAAGHSQDYSSGFGHPVPVINNGVFGQSGTQTGGIQNADSFQSNPQGFRAGRYERPGIQAADVAHTGGQNINSGGFGQSVSQAFQSLPSGVFLQPSAHATAQAASQNFNSVGAEKYYSEAASQSASHAASHIFATEGFLQPSAHAIGQAASQNFNSGGAEKSFSKATSQSVSQATSQNFATGGFLQPSGQAIAEATSQNFNSGGTQKSFSQATSQSSSTTHRGPQFFQVLGPSSFINTRSDSALVGSPRGNKGFVMPHMQNIPVSDLLHDMETEANNFPGSEDPKSNNPESLSFATEIAQFSLGKDSPMPHEESGEKTEQNNGHRTQIFKRESFPKEKYKIDETMETLGSDNAKDVNLLTSNKNISVHSRDKRNTANNSINTESDINKSDTNGSLDTVDDKTVRKRDPDNLLRTSEETEKQTSNDEAKGNKLEFDIKALTGSVLQTDNTDTTNSVTENVLGSTVVTKVNSIEMPNGSLGKTTEIPEVSENVDHEMIEMVNPEDLTTTESISVVTSTVNDKSVDNDKDPKEQEDAKIRHSSVTNDNEKILVSSILNTPQESNSETPIGGIKAQGSTVEDTSEHGEITENSGHQLSLLETSNNEPTAESATDMIKNPGDTVEISSEFTIGENLEYSTAATPGSLVETVTSEHSPLIIGGSEASSESILGMSPNSRQEQFNNNVVSTKDKFEVNGIIRDNSHSNEDSSEENKNNSTVRKTFSENNTTQSSKNLTSLTLEEIEDIQFRIPDNATDFPENITTSKSLENNELNQVENKVVDSPRNFSFPFHDNGSKIVFDPSGAPFDSIEAEMSILTDEEKEAFIKQEMELISEVIEETLKNDQFWGKGLKEHNKTQDHDDIDDDPFMSSFSSIISYYEMKQEAQFKFTLIS